MGKYPFIDTNIFLRFLVEDPVNSHLNQHARGIFTRIEKGDLEVQVNLPVALEVVHVLKKYYQKSFREIISLFEPLISLPSIYFRQKEQFISALRLSAEINVDLADSYTYLQMMELGIKEIYTFDRKHFKRFDDITLLPG